MPIKHTYFFLIHPRDFHSPIRSSSQSSKEQHIQESPKESDFFLNDTLENLNPCLFFVYFLTFVGLEKRLSFSLNTFGKTNVLRLSYQIKKANRLIVQSQSPLHILNKDKLPFFWPQNKSVSSKCIHSNINKLKTYASKREQKDKSRRHTCVLMVGVAVSWELNPHCRFNIHKSPARQAL